jgi:hypothetical protein
MNSPLLMQRATKPKAIAKNPNHNLWLNNGVWWVHFTVHLPDYTSRRVRRSLNTKDESEARRLRDEILYAPELLIS